MKKLKVKVSKKQHVESTHIQEEKSSDSSNKVHHAKMEYVKRMGRQKKVMRIASPGQGLAKWKLK